MEDLLELSSMLPDGYKSPDIQAALGGELEGVCNPGTIPIFDICNPGAVPF